MKNLKKLLQENNLMHYKFDEKNSRLIYIGNSELFLATNDFNRLINLLKDNKIKYTNMGIDVVMIEDEV